MHTYLVQAERVLFTDATLLQQHNAVRPGTAQRSFLVPDGEIHHIVDLVPPDKAAEGEALELDDEDVGQAPQHELLGCLTVLLTLWAVPAEKVTEKTEQQATWDCLAPLALLTWLLATLTADKGFPQHFCLVGNWAWDLVKAKHGVCR